MKAFLTLPAPHNPQIPLGMGQTPRAALDEALAWTDGNVLDGVQILPCTDVLFRHFQSLGSFHSVQIHRYGSLAYAFLNNPAEAL